MHVFKANQLALDSQLVLPFQIQASFSSRNLTSMLRLMLFFSYCLYGGRERDEMCVHTCELMCKAYGGYKSTLCIFIYRSQLYIFERVSLPELEIDRCSQVDSPMSFRDLSVCLHFLPPHLPSLELQPLAATPSSYISTRDPKSRPNACTAETVKTKPLRQGFIIQGYKRAGHHGKASSLWNCTFKFL